MQFLFKPGSLSAQTFGIKDYRRFLSARFFLTVALQMQAVIISFEIYRITRDVMALGYIGLAEAIPALSLALFGGHVADKYSRRNILLLCYAGLVFAFAIIAAISHPDIFSKFNSHDYVYLLYGLIFFTGVVRAFLAPANFSLIPQLVPRDLLANASTWNSSAWQIAAIIGPATGGILYAQIGMFWSMVLVVCLLVTGLVNIAMIRYRPLPVQDSEEGIWERLRSGISYVFKNKIIIGALSLDLFSVLFGGAVALLPAFTHEILHVGAEELGYLRAAPNAGSAIMLILLTFKRSFKHPGKTLLQCVAGFGLCMILFAVSHNYILSLVILFFSGVFDSVSVMIRSVILQLQTPDNMRGRVASVNTMFIGSSNELGALESGFAARIMGLVPSVIFGGCMTLLVVIITRFKAKELQTLKF